MHKSQIFVALERRTTAMEPYRAQELNRTDRRSEITMEARVRRY